MRELKQLIDEDLARLSGAEFKIAAYLYRRLGGRRDPELVIPIAALAAATGVSWRRTQAVLRSLAEREIVIVTGGQGRTTSCRLPPSLPANRLAPRLTEPPRPVSVAPVPGPPAPTERETTAPRSDGAGGTAGAQPAGAESTPPKAGADPRPADPNREAIELITRLFKAPDAAFLERLRMVSGGIAPLVACLRELAAEGSGFDPDTPGLLVSAVAYRCRRSCPRQPRDDMRAGARPP